MSIGSRIVCAFAVCLPCMNAAEAGQEKLVQKVYQVADLVIVAENCPSTMPVPKVGTPARSGEASKTGTVAVVVKQNRPATNEDRLIKIITSTIAPRSWAENGGVGTIDYHPLTMALVINQTPDVQDQIKDLLAALRREMDRQVAVEVKFASVSEETFQHLGLNEKEETILKPKQVCRLMEKIQSDIHSNVMQAPKMTMFNGQETKIDVTDERTFVTGLEVVYRNGHLEYQPKSETVALGTRLGLRSVISPDRRSVQVRLDAKLSNLVSDDVAKIPLRISTPIEVNASNAEAKTITQFIDTPRIDEVSVERTLSIADGHTAVLSGPTQECEARAVTKVPVLGDLPFLGRFFSDSKSSRYTQHLLVLVTPHIIVCQEEEQKHSHKAKNADAAILPCAGEDGRNDFRTLILPADFNEGKAACSTTPDEARILRALAKPMRLPGVYEESREDIQIVTERIVDKVDAPRFFPLVGPARLHHCHWKCTVYYMQTIRGTYPMCFQWRQPRREVVYMDSDHLHLVSANDWQGK